jgi:hypothetical protein
MKYRSEIIGESGSAPRYEPSNPKILAVIDKTPNGHGYIIRALYDRQVIYIRVPEKAFAPGWDLLPNPEPILSMISNEEHKVWRLEVLEQGRDGIATKLQADTDGVPTKLYGGVPGLDHISSLAHIVVVDYMELTKIRSISDSCSRRRSDRINIATHPTFKEKAIMKIAEIPDRLPTDENDETQISRGEDEMSNEISYHQELSRSGFVPKFLGLITEKNRGIIGYLSEYIEGARTYEDIKKDGKILADTEVEACLNVARKMHGYGVYHGDLDLYNFLKCPDGSIRIIDFEHAQRLGEDGRVHNAPIYSADNELGMLEICLRAIGRPSSGQCKDY